MKRTLLSLLCAFPLLCGPADQTREGRGIVDPSIPPVLVLATDLHTAPIRALSVSGDGRLLLTVSEDKTARLWDPATGRPLRVVRPTIEPGKVGMLYAGALSPDGRLAALGGWTRSSRDAGQRILLLETATGRYVRILDAGSQVVNHLAFSPDGQRLVAHLGGTSGLRLYRVADGALLAQDPDYASPTYQGAFDGQGNYAASSDDGFLRLYDPALRLLKKLRAPEAAPFGLAFSPDGGLLAVAYAGSPAVDVLRMPGLEPSLRPRPGATNLGLVAWSADGQTLFAAGGEDFGPAPNPLRRWTQGGRGPGTDQPLARATVSGLVPLPGGGLAFAAQDPAWGVLDAEGRSRVSRAAPLADLRAAREAFRVDPQGLCVALPGRAFSLEALSLVPAPAAWPSPSPTAGVQGWRDGEHPAFQGRALDLEPFECSRSLCAAPGGGFLLGTDWWLRAYDAQGAPRWKVPLPAAAWALAHRQDGRVAVALLADGTCRWYRAADGQELLALFVAEDQRWVLWTPSGCFCASIGGEDLVGWQRNRVDQAADCFPVTHFRARFWKPDLMLPLLETLDEGKALARLQAGPPPAAPVPEELPYVPRILAPRPETAVQGGEVTFQVALRAFGTPKAVQAFRVFLDGARGADAHALPAGLDGGDRVYPVVVDLPRRPVTVGFQAELEGGRLSARTEVRLTSAPGPATVLPAAPVLRLLLVGVADYADQQFNLQFPAKDAADLGELFKAQEGKLFDHVEVFTLVNDRATEKAILKAMDDLVASSGPGTVTLYFFSSHGGSGLEGTGYIMIPYDFGQGSGGVDGDAIRKRLEATRGRTLMLMDTCHSGNVLGEGRMRGVPDQKYARFINELVQCGPGTVVLSSSKGTQASLESPAWNHGAFTKALLEGLAGAADPGHTGRITTEMLEDFVRRRVLELTHGKQAPVAAKGEAAQGFPVAVD